MSGEKTEDPTPTKLKELRKKGQVARSQELPAAAALVVLVLLLPSLARRSAAGLHESVVVGLSAAGTPDLGLAIGMLGDQVVAGAEALAPSVLVVLGATAVASMAVTREKPNPQALRARFDRMSPKNGLKRLFGVQALFELGKNSAKLALLGAVCVGVWGVGSARLLGGPAPVETSGALVADSVMQLVTWAAVVALAVGLADAAWARKRWRKSAKMTKNEVKDDHKKSEGDPQMKAARRSRALTLSRINTIAATKDADVVLANPTHVAVALKYVDGDLAPTVVARGAGVIAARMRETAAEHDVTIHVDVPLARALHGACGVGDQVPPAFWTAVAEVLAAVYRARARRPARLAAPVVPALPAPRRALPATAAAGTPSARTSTGRAPA